MFRIHYIYILKKISFKEDISDLYNPPPQKKIFLSSVMDSILFIYASLIAVIFSP